MSIIEGRPNAHGITTFWVTNLGRTTAVTVHPSGQLFCCSCPPGRADRCTHTRQVANHLTPTIRERLAHASQGA